MSTGFECEFVQTGDSEWFYVLQDWDCPVGAWDWREYSTAYGPFKDYESACGHLRDNHANPGGHGISDRRGTELPETLAERIKEARERKPEPLHRIGRGIYTFR